jgi:DNA-directed RNA polymerase subunit RPC12/RpoP
VAVSVLRPAACPECGSQRFTERWRHEAGEFGLLEDTAGYDCEDCLAEFGSNGEVFRKGDRSWA